MLMANIAISSEMSKGGLKINCSREQLMAYFKSVCKLVDETHDEFPVCLDDVWPLVYGRKEEAVRALTTDFQYSEGVDYKVLRKNAENPLGGRPTNEYHLSVSCLEHFIARKKREVFEVYRQFFHKVRRGEMTLPHIPSIPQTFAEALRLAADQAEQIEQQQKLLVAQNQTIIDLNEANAEMRVKVSYYDQILASKSTVTTTQIAQDYGMSAKKFNIILRNLKIQRKVGGQWILYAPHNTVGYVHSDTFVPENSTTGKVVMITKWTQKGRLFLYDVLKRNDILPLIEQ